MNIFTAACSIISVVLAIYCFLPYVRSILNGTTKPHQFSWIIFGIMNGMITVSQYLIGARLSVLITAAFFIENLITIGLSFKYGLRDTSKYDRLLFGFCLVTILVWIITKNNELAIWLTILIDIFATTMMILKIKARPNSEAISPWIIATLAYTFSCLTLINKPFGILYLKPLYGLISDIAIVLAIHFSRFRSYS